jgi:hypothetical protein
MGAGPSSWYRKHPVIQMTRNVSDQTLTVDEGTNAKEPVAKRILLDHPINTAQLTFPILSEPSVRQ